MMEKLLVLASLAIVAVAFVMAGAPATVEGFVLRGNRWPSAATSFSVDIPGFDGQWNGAFETAMFRWNDATIFDFSIHRDTLEDPCDGLPSSDNSGDFENGVAFTADICGDAFGEDVLAMQASWSSGGTLVQSNIHFNNSLDWSIYDGPWKTPYDFRRVAVHELGHTIGLLHEDDVPSIMTTHASSAGERVLPSADDIAGVAALYSSTTPVPANDNFEDAAVATGSSGTIAGTNVGATLETEEPIHNGSASVWWIWTAPTSGTFLLDTEGSDFDTILAVYTGASLRNLVEVASNDDIETGVITTSAVSFTVTASLEYHIAVAGWSVRDEGNIVLNWHLDLRPGQPTLLSPADGSTEVSMTPTLRWSAATGATSYNIYLGATTNPPLVHTTTDTSYQSGPLELNKTYSWHVESRNDFDTSGFEDQYFFRTGSRTDGVASDVHVFPQMVDGTSGDGTTWLSFLIATNPGSGGVICTLVPRGGLDVSRLAQPSTFFLGPSGGSTLILTTGSESQSLALGYATVSCTKPITAQLTYLNRRGSETISMATVLSSPSATSVQVQFLSFSGFRTAIALANDDSVETRSCDITVSKGETVLGEDTLDIEPRTNSPAFLDELVQFDPSAGTGVVRIDCDGPFHATGLLFRGSSFTTLPATVLVAN